MSLAEMMLIFAVIMVAPHCEKKTAIRGAWVLNALAVVMIVAEKLK